MGSPFVFHRGDAQKASPFVHPSCQTLGVANIMNTAAQNLEILSATHKSSAPTRQRVGDEVPVPRLEAKMTQTPNSSSTTGQLILESILRCPKCGNEKLEAMATDFCQYFYECTSCHALLRPTAGDCCVFCSFGSVKCPPIQHQRCCCG